MSDDPLSQTNRFVIVVAALIVIFVTLLVALLAWSAPDQSITRLQDVAGWLRSHNDRETKLILTLTAAVITLGMLTAIIVELTPSPTQKMRVRNVTSGSAAITTSQIAARIDSEVSSIEYIAACQATVAARGQRIEVVLDLHLHASADLATAADDACRRTQDLIERQLGIELVQPPRARLHYRELRLRERDDTEGSRRAGDVAQQASSGWERPDSGAEVERDERRQPDAPEEAQA